MTTLLNHMRVRNYISRASFFGCMLALTTIVSAPEVWANNLKICKKTIPPTAPAGPLFNFIGANSWPATSSNSFGNIPSYQPNPFKLKDSNCRTFNITGHDQFNKITETAPPSGWTLTNITCNYSRSVVNIIGANPNPAYQPGDNTVTIDQTEPNVTCTFVNTCAFRSQNFSTGVTQWRVTRPSGATALAFSVVPYPNWATHSPPAVSGPPFPPGTSWIQPANSPTSAVSEPGGTYIYQLRFSIPCPGKVQGWFAADNAATLVIDANPPIPCLGNPTLCFKQANITNFSQPVGAGAHVIKFTVNNQGPSPTGLLANITVQ